MNATRPAFRLSGAALGTVGIVLLLGLAAPAMAIPIADANGPYVGTVGVPVGLDGSGSFDLDDPLVLFEWDFEGDGTFDFSSPSTTLAIHAYGVAGTFSPTLRITNALGVTATDSTVALIAAANRVPEPGPLALFLLGLAGLGALRGGLRGQPAL